MAVQREIAARSILTKSGISDYAVNCYVGCLHNCVYCYARCMRKFTGHEEPWGRFLDVKINAAELMAVQTRRTPPGRIIFSSACDPYQPAERKYGLTRRCIEIAAEAGFGISVLTKSALVVRDLDVIGSARERSVGCTITTVDESLRRRLEPAADSAEARLRALQSARDKGVRTWVFCGPLLPGLTATPESIEKLFARVARSGAAEEVLVDKLNFRSGVYASMMDLLHRHYPHLVPLYRSLRADAGAYESYVAGLRETARELAVSNGIACRMIC